MLKYTQRNGKQHTGGKAMTKYRGYYIDHVIFNSKAEIDEDAEECCKNKDAEVAIIVGRQTDMGTAKKVTAILDRLKITHDTKVVCPIRSNKKFTNYVKSMKKAKIFIGISSNSSQVTGGIVGLTARPVIGVPCTNENGDDYRLTVVSMPPGVPVATMAINGAKNAALYAVQILALTDETLAAKLDAFRKEQTQKVLDATI